MCSTHACPLLATAIKPPPQRHWCSHSSSPRSPHPRLSSPRPRRRARLVLAVELTHESTAPTPQRWSPPGMRRTALAASTSTSGGARPVPGRVHGTAGLSVARHMKAEHRRDPNPASATRCGKEHHHPPTLLRGPHGGGAQGPYLGPRQRGPVDDVLQGAPQPRADAVRGQRPSAFQQECHGAEAVVGCPRPDPRLRPRPHRHGQPPAAHDAVAVLVAA
jgi:hypothetical protein